MTQTMSTRAGRVWCAATAILAAVLAVTAGPAAADPIVTEHVVTVPTMWLTALSALIVNLSTAFATKVTARSWVKALTALAFTFATSVIQDALAHDGAIFTANLFDIFMVTLIASAATWVTVTKPFGVPEVTAPQSGLV